MGNNPNTILPTVKIRVFLPEMSNPEVALLLDIDTANVTNRSQKLNQITSSVNVIHDTNLCTVSNGIEFSSMHITLQSKCVRMYDPQPTVAAKSNTTLAVSYQSVISQHVQLYHFKVNFVFIMLIIKKSLWRSLYCFEN